MIRRGGLETRAFGRRTFVAGAAATVAAAAMGGRATGQDDAGFERPLAVPPLLSGDPQPDGSRRFALRAAPASWRAIAGAATPTWSYGGGFVGPTLRLERGVPATIAVRNGLPIPTTTHWHGALVSGAVDGGPHSIVAPGGRTEVRFALDQPAATLWYHPHPNDRTGPSVWAGLAGMLIVADRAGGPRLPETYGVDDVPLVLQDRRFAPDGSFAYMTQPADLMGMKGDRFLVNGRERPYLAVPAQLVRLRVLNASNARIYNLGFDDGRPFAVVASDGGLLAAPVTMTRLLLAPAERAEIVVDFSRDRDRTAVLRTYSGEAVPQLTMMAMDDDPLDRATVDLLQFRVGDRRPGAVAELPPTLAALPPVGGAATASRRFTLQGESNVLPSPLPATPRGGPGAMALGVGGLDAFSIDRRYMRMGVVNFTVPLRSTQTWDLVSESDMAHPIHLHGTQFRIASRDGAPPPPHERGWKDTVLVRRRETVRIVARFDHPATAARPYMYHCHILEHEDNGMMGQFTVG